MGRDVANVFGVGFPKRLGADSKQLGREFSDVAEVAGTEHLGNVSKSVAREISDVPEVGNFLIMYVSHRVVHGTTFPRPGASHTSQRIHT